MSLFDAFRKKKKEEKPRTPVEPGRISRETTYQALQKFQGEWTFLDPEIPAEILEAIERFTIIIPDFSQNAKNIVNLGNTGHTLEVEAATDRIVQQAEERLNMLARDIFPYGGMDGLVNKMLWDIAVFGSPSIEAVIRNDLQGVKKVVTVPIPEIRFKYDPAQETYLPYQKIGNALDDYLELNTFTYYYSPLLQRRNSPYAIPPTIAALSPLVNQLFMNENVRYIVKKLGLLGLIHAILSTPPRKPQETEEQYLSRLKTYLSDVATDLTKNYRDGVMITYDEIALKHFEVTGNITGVKDLFQLNEEQIASGLNTDPAMLGRSYSTTETYAGVVYSKLTKEIENAQRIIKRGAEKIYLLDLLLARIPVSDVNIDFQPGAKLNPKEDAEIENLHSKDVTDQYFSGIITLDEAREELEYPPLDTVEGNVGATSQIKVKFQFQKGKYIFVHPRISLNPVRDLSLNGVKKKSISLQSEESIEDNRLNFVENYLSQLKNIDDISRKEIIQELKDMAARNELPENPDDFAEKVYQVIEKRYPEVAHNNGLIQAIEQNIKTIYAFYRLQDTSLWGDNPPIRTDLTLPDKRTQKFLGRVDEMFYSDYLTNEPLKDQLKTYLRDEVIEKGLPAADAVLDKFEGQWGDLSEYQVRRIVDTSVTRTRTFAHVRQMKEANIRELENVEIMDRITCGRCREQDGKIVKVAIADEVVEQALKLSPEEFKERYIKGVPTEKELMTTPMEDLVSKGKGLAPIHPNCRGRIMAVRKKGLFQFEAQRGEELQEIERCGTGNYSDYGKKVTYSYSEKGTPKSKEGIRKTDQTLIYSTKNVLGQKIYLTKQGIQHTINDHPKERKMRDMALSISATIVGDPNQIYLDKNKGKSNNTKIYIKTVRSKDYAVVTKRCGPEIIWSAFAYNGEKGEAWEKIYDYRTQH